MFIRNVLSATALAMLTSTAGANTVAHWTFDSEADFNAGILRDVTGNGNDMYIQSANNPGAANQAEFSNDTFATPYANNGAIRFNGTRNGPNGATGQFYQTQAGAPINGMTFENGYTVEVMFKVPTPYSPTDNRWMGMLSRTEKPNGDSPATFAISNLGEVQWQTQEVDPAGGGREEAVWSPVLFPPNDSSGNDYVHVAAVNYQATNGDWHVDLYVNGFLGSRNIVDSDHNGLTAYPNGLWNIGTNMWDATPGNFFNGWIDDIRISDTALSPTEFTNVIPEPGSLALLTITGLVFAHRRRRA